MLYRVWNVTDRAGDPGQQAPDRLLFSVSSPEEARQTIDHIRQQHAADPLHSGLDSFGLECLGLTGWREWRDPNGNDIHGTPEASTDMLPPEKGTEEAMSSDFDRVGEELDRLIREVTQSAYSHVVVEEANSPRNMRRLAKPDAFGTIHGWCGDTMEIYLQLAGGRIETATFMTDGCGPTIACGSMLTKMVTQAPLAEASKITPELLIEALGGLPEENAHCAELAVRTLQEAIASCAQQSRRLTKRT